MENKLKEYRILAGYTQAELSEKADVSRTTISELENGKLEVTTTATLVKIAKALDRKVCDIFLC